MIAVPSALAKAVAVKTAPVFMPLAPKTLGLTNKMYDILMKVVKPAINSTLMLVLYLSS